MFLSIFIVIFVSCGIEYIDNKVYSNSKKTTNEIVEEKNKKEKNDKNDIVSQKMGVGKNNGMVQENDTKEKYDWYIEIPKIELYAPIEEGTSDEILNRSVGHFEETARRNGNCGLAAHNRGYKVNYFSRLKELEKGDIVYYFVDGKKYKYEIEDSLIIYETDWSVLEETEDDEITLITCVENRAEYRLCVKGTLVEE